MEISVSDYIASVKKADRQSCVNCIDTLLLKEISDNKDKVCSSAKQLQAAFQATDDFKKMVRYAKNPLLYLSKLATLISQIKERYGATFFPKIETEVEKKIEIPEESKFAQPVKKAVDLDVGRKTNIRDIVIK